MKFYSENLHKLFDSEKELTDAELAAQKAKEAEEAKKKELTETRKARAKEVDAAREEVYAARKKYHTLLDAFVKDYGSYHASYSSHDLASIDDIFDCFFNNL